MGVGDRFAAGPNEGALSGHVVEANPVEAGEMAGDPRIFGGVIDSGKVAADGVRLGFTCAPLNRGISAVVGAAVVVAYENHSACGDAECHGAQSSQNSFDPFVHLRIPNGWFVLC
jgi:hypothetical protein